jgi:hypothetical protein
VYQGEDHTGRRRARGRSGSRGPDQPRHAATVE